MRSLITRQIGRYAFAIAALALTVPFATGCSTLGIATTEELTDLESRIQTSGRTSNTRLDKIETDQATILQQMSEISASIDSLNTSFANASEWLKTMNLDTISADAKNATNAATLAEARSRKFLDYYLAWIKSQHTALEKQIADLEASMKPAAEESEKPAEDTSGDDSSDDSGGN